jgi:hypothetical protein
MPVPRPSVEFSAKLPDRRQPSLYRSCDQLNHLAGVAKIGQVEHGALDREPRRILHRSRWAYAWRLTDELPWAVNLDAPFPRYQYVERVWRVWKQLVQEARRLRAEPRELTAEQDAGPSQGVPGRVQWNRQEQSSREPAPCSGFHETADAVTAEALTQSLIPRHHISLHCCKLEQAVGYVMPWLHVVSVLS